MCSVHGLARNVGTVLYTFLATDKSRNLTAYRKTALYDNTSPT